MRRRTVVGLSLGLMAWLLTEAARQQQVRETELTD
jgi:hypothetical protein